MSKLLNENKIEKLVILGSGPAGLTAGIYAARADLKPLIIEGSQPGGQLISTSFVENWPGHNSILGPDLMLNIRKHAINFGARLLSETVIKADISKRPFILETNKQNIIQTHSLIISTGATPKKLNCPGEDRLWSKGVTTCAVCDGVFYKNKKIIVVGGGDSAMETASFMTKFTDDITLVHILPQLTASFTMQQKIINNKNIKIIYSSSINQILGEDCVTGVELADVNTGQVSRLEADGVFINIGLTPNTQLFKDQLELTPHGYITLHGITQTSVKGVFAAGDVADYVYRQAITSAGSGCAASLDAERYLSSIL